MNRFLRNLFIFALLTILIYPVFLLLYGRVTPQMLRPNLIYPLGWKGHLHTRVADVQNYKNVDVLVLGSSHAYRGFDPRIFEEHGVTMFNMGSSGQSPVNAKVLLERYLDTLNPKIAILVIGPSSFHVDGVESSLDIIANDENDRHSFEMAYKINHLKTYNTLIYGFLRNVFQLDSKFKEAKLRENERYIAGGYVEKESVNKKVMSYDSLSWKWKAFQIDAFEDNLDMLKQKNIKVILLQNPVSSAMYSAFSNKQKFEALMKDYGEYYNFNELVTLNDTLHFYDAHHLNKAGVRIFNERLFEVIDLNSMID